MLVKWKLPYVFLVSFFGFIFFPGTHLLFFAPFLVVSYYKCDFFQALWIAAGTGLLNDLFTSAPFGASSCVYCVTTYFLYRQNRNFFEDKISTLFIMTALFSLISTPLTFVFYFLLGKAPILSLSFILTDFVIMPVIDGAYAYLFFSLPFQLYRRYYLLKKQAED